MSRRRTSRRRRSSELLRELFPVASACPSSLLTARSRAPPEETHGCNQGSGRCCATPPFSSPTWPRGRDAQGRSSRSRDLTFPGDAFVRLVRASYLILELAVSFRQLLFHFIRSRHRIAVVPRVGFKSNGLADLEFMHGATHRWRHGETAAKCASRDRQNRRDKGARSAPAPHSAVGSASELSAADA
jgi:hypothetical protein